MLTDFRAQERDPFAPRFGRMRSWPMSLGTLVDALPLRRAKRNMGPGGRADCRGNEPSSGEFCLHRSLSGVEETESSFVQNNHSGTAASTGSNPASAIPKSSEPGADQGWTGAKLEGLLDPKIQWKAHNYNHLHEAPTVFYAVALVLAIIGQGDGLNATIAWIYVFLRIVHSIWQATVNRVMVRFALFSLSSLALIALILHAAMALFHG